MRQYIDLHMHSTCSDDGEFTPTELVRQCKEAGIRIMSITDHDSTKGNAEARTEAEKLGIAYISGIELDCRFQGRNFHLLGYGFDDSRGEVAALGAQIIAAERNASRARLEKTRALGFDISEAELNAIANIDEGDIWTGETFGEVLFERADYREHPMLRPYRSGGERADNPYVNFYWDFYGQGSPCYVEIDLPDMTEAIRVIQESGGLAVLAHPGHNLKGQFELFDEIVKAGIDGVEVFCSYHDEPTAQYFYEQAVKYGLLITCGSDYHGKIKPSVKLGESGCWLDPQEMERQLAKRIKIW